MIVEDFVIMNLAIFCWFRQNSPMPRYQPDPRKYPAKPGGNGWLFSEQQQLVCQFKADNPSAHAEWVSVNTYRWIPPGPLVPQTRRRMLRHNAIEAWQAMQKTGWRRCPPPLRWIKIQMYLLCRKFLWIVVAAFVSGLSFFGVNVLYNSYTDQVVIDKNW